MSICWNTIRGTFDIIPWRIEREIGCNFFEGGAVRYAPINFLCIAGVGVGSGAPDILWYPLMVERASFSVPGAYPSLIV